MLTQITYLANIDFLKERSIPENILYFSLGIILSCIFLYFNLRGIEAKIALSGFSPIHYTHLKLFPENFAANFRSGVETYDMSLLMGIYPLLAKYFHIPPELTLKWMIGAEYAVLFLMSYSLVHNLIETDNPSLLTFILWLLFCSSNAMNINLANNGYFIQGQFYNFAYLFSILGIIFMLKNKYELSICFLLLAIMTHTIFGGIAAFLAFSTFLVVPRTLLHKRVLFSFALLCLGSIIWLAWIMIQAETASGAIPQELWLSMTRLFNCHWYPYHLGYLTVNSAIFLIPFLCFLMLLIHYFPDKSQMNETHKKVVCIIASALALTVLGIAITIFYPHPTLIKLHVIRASFFIVVIGWVYVLSGILQDVKNKNSLQSTVALAVLIIPFLISNCIFMILPTLFLIRFSISNVFEKTDRYSPKQLLLLILLRLVTFLVGLKIMEGWGAFQSFLFEESGLKFWKIMLALFLCFLIVRIIKEKSKIFNGKLVTYLCTLSLILSSLYFQKNNMLKGEKLENGKNYLEVQRWAKLNTPNDSLFMVDPTIYYGWRDFSERSSFGNVREWLHVSWLYDSRKAAFDDGMKRFSLFNLPLENYYVGFFPTINGSIKLSSDVRQAFYGFDEDWFKKIQNNYGVSYLVMFKANMNRPLNFLKVFENQRYIVYKLSSSVG